MTDILVLHVIQNLNRGGAGRALLAQAARSAARGATRHRILSLLPAEKGAAAAARAAGIPVLSAPDAALIESEAAAADMVQIHFWNGPEMYRLLQQALPAARLLIWFHIGGQAPPQMITPAVVELADLALACCAYSAALPVLHDRTPPLPDIPGFILASADFARLDGFVPQPHDGIHVGYIGTVDPVKMHGDFVPMSAAIDVPGIRFIVCGAGRTDELRRQAMALGVAERFEFAGHVEDIRPVLASLDLFGYPLCDDNYAGSELALQEAMFAGVPPVVLPYGGAAALVQDGETGVVVRSAEDYSAAVARLCRSPSERRRLGANARAYALAHFGLDKTVSQFEALYRAMLALPKRRRPPLPASTGAALFVRSLGDGAPQFAASLHAESDDTALAADRTIARSSPLLASVASGGVQHYRHCFVDDGHLRLWSGLILRQGGQNARALFEFRRAVDLGCDHWRVYWYLAQTASRLEAGAVAEAALAAARLRAPDRVAVLLAQAAAGGADA